MKRIENRFWRMLDNRPYRTATLPDWQRAAGPEFGLFENMFHPVEGLAQYITDPDDIDGFMLSVVDYGNGKYGAIDEGMTRRIPLTLDDIIRYKLDFKDFQSLLAGVFEFEPDFGEMPSDSLEPIRFGMCRVKPGVEFPVYMILARDRRIMLELTATLLAAEKNSFFLMAATRRNWAPDILQLIRDRKSQIVSLEECLLVENGSFAKSEAWDNAVNEFRSIHYPENLVEAPPPYEFRKKGEMWAIRFDGEETFLKDSQGLRCIAQLLAKPNDPVFVTELRAVLNGQPPDTVVVQKTPREDVVDKTTLSELKRRYLELQAELSEAQTDGNEIMEREAEQEMEQIVQHLCQIKGMNGETRKINDDFEKARSATSKAFWRSVNLIRDDAPQLATHLENSCVVGMVCNYSPDRAIHWNL
jgi:hypothetical protein